MKMTYGYIRVSTVEQNLENQKKAIAERFAVDEWVEEKRSGTVDYSKRSLGALVEKAREGDVLKLSVSFEGRPFRTVTETVCQLFINSKFKQVGEGPDPSRQNRLPDAGPPGWTPPSHPENRLPEAQAGRTSRPRCPWQPYGRGTPGVHRQR